MSANRVENVKTCLNQLSVGKIYARSYTKYLLVIGCLKSKKKVLSNGNMFLQKKIQQILGIETVKYLSYIKRGVKVQMDPRSNKMAGTTKN